MFTWLEKGRQILAKEKRKELGFGRSLMVYDDFKTHKTDNVKVLLATANTNLARLPAGFTSKCQLLDLCTL